MDKTVRKNGQIHNFSQRFEHLSHRIRNHKGHINVNTINQTNLINIYRTLNNKSGINIILKLSGDI